MSDLQIGLILIGVLVVVAVYAFNRFQERQFQRRMESKFRERPSADALLDGAGPPAADQRVEPRLAAETEDADEIVERGFVTDGAPLAAPAAQSVIDPIPETPPPAPVEAVVPEAAPVRHTEPALAPIDYVCELETAESIAPAVLAEFLKAVTAIGKPVHVIGLNPRTNEWIPLRSAPAGSLFRIQASLQLADRSGPANRVQLSSMRDLMHELADRVGGACECPDIDRAAHAAAEIDRFCAQVDVSIGCNLVPSGGGGLSGTKVRGLLESAGFTLDHSGRFVLRADDGTVLMSVHSMDGEALSAERLRAAPVPGLTLTMDVPRVPAGGRVFERMLELGRHLAQALDAIVVDDNRARLTDAGTKLIRQQLRNVHAAMEAQGIPAGGPLAARLFS